jgi:prepilin-type N-terminal cleavage/methylation domain-containing protein
MKRGEQGFSLLELMIALALVASVIAAATTFFIGVVNQYKVQTKITESNVEGIIGLELMRRDIESLGFGLPWDLNGSSYTEPAPLGDASNPPRAVGSIDGGTDNSDYLVIRSARVGMADAAGKWTTLRSGPLVRNWGSPNDDLANTDHVIVISPGDAINPSRVLLTPQAGSPFGDNGASLSLYVSVDTHWTNIVYGIDNISLSRPFNRADYYIANDSAYPPTYDTPVHCASNTGVLVKTVRAHDSDARTPLPLLDCVADMQVTYGLDTDADPATPLVLGNNLSSLTADAIRTQLKEVRVYILAQVGQRDRSYRYPADNVYLGPPGGAALGIGRNFDFTTSGIADFRNYRWKVYGIVVQPKSLAN